MHVRSLCLSLSLYIYISLYLSLYLSISPSLAEESLYDSALLAFIQGNGLKQHVASISALGPATLLVRGLCCLAQLDLLVSDLVKTCLA